MHTHSNKYCPQYPAWKGCGRYTDMKWYKMSRLLKAESGVEQRFNNILCGIVLRVVGRGRQAEPDFQKFLKKVSQDFPGNQSWESWSRTLPGLQDPVSK